MKQLGYHDVMPIVSFLVVDNDKALADQSADGVKRTMGCENVKLFILSSNSKSTIDEIKTKRKMRLLIIVRRVMK